ncbi:putative RNA-directed DNA polymerase [Tanacetum coccineum]
MAEDSKIKIDKFDGHNFRLSLARNVAYNVVNEKATYSLIKALSNMYEKPIASNKSWSDTVTTISGSTGTTKLKFDNIRDLILGEDIRRKTSREYSNSLLSAEDKGRTESKTEGRSRTKCPKPVASNDKEVYMVVRDYDDALVCCAENTIEDHIMDFGASFHATYCKEELERFRLRSGKDVRYIPGLKRKLISFGQLDEEGYHVGFGDQQWKVTKGSLVVARGNKRGSLYMVEVPYDGINTAIDGRGNATLWHQRLGHMSEKGMKILASKGRIPNLQKRLELVHTNVYGPTTVASIGGSRYYVTFIDDSSRKCLKSDNGGEYSSREFIEYCVENGIWMLKTVPETPQENGVAERMNRTLNERAKKEEWQGKEVSLIHLRVFGCDSYVKVKDVSREKPDAKSMKCTCIGYGSNEMGYRFWDSRDHRVVRCQTPKI